MEFIDLKKQYSELEDDIKTGIEKVLEHGRYIMGPEVQELESELKNFVGAKYCISCSSGTDALLIPLMAWNIGPGDAVFVPCFTFFATAEVVALLGATPIFVDIDPQSYNMDPKALNRAIEAVKKQDPEIYPLPKKALETPLIPRGIITVDLYGLASAYDEILSLAKKEKLYVLEDAAQSFGAKYKGEMLCNLGCHASATSFFPAKPLGCYGDGGAIFTDNDELAELCESIRVHGKGEHGKYDNARIGLNGRLDTMQASILLSKMKIFPKEIEQRQVVAKWYKRELEGIKDLVLPSIPEDMLSVYAQYCVLVKNGKRQMLRDDLKKKNIPTQIYYPRPLNLLSAFADYEYKEGDMPVAEKICTETMALPFHPYLSEDEVKLIAKAIKESV